MKQWKMESKIGPIYLVTGEIGLCGIYWKKQAVPMAERVEEIPVLRRAIGQIVEYLEGERCEFDLPLEPAPGTDFQKRVWSELRKIPYGSTISYAELAARIQNHKAVRAVGSANGKNPLSLVVPCHRVIASNGTLGGYAGGLEAKQLLLDLEKQKIRLL